MYLICNIVNIKRTLWDRIEQYKALVKQNKKNNNIRQYINVLKEDRDVIFLYWKLRKGIFNDMYPQQIVILWFSDVKEFLVFFVVFLIFCYFFCLMTNLQ